MDAPRPVPIHPRIPGRSGGRARACPGCLEDSRRARFIASLAVRLAPEGAC
ncbi:hypothetical protein ACFPRL_15230 [Pseudoclavibacter helvolus]